MYEDKWRVDLDNINVRESILRSVINNNRLKHVYLSSQISYKEKWGFNFDNFQVRESIAYSGDSLEV